VTTEINWLAVLVSAAVTFFVGGAWYSPLLFAKPWMAANNYTPERMEAMKQASSPAKAMAVSFVVWLVMAACFAVLLSWTGLAGWQGGLKLALLLWVGFAAAVTLVGTMFSDRRITAFVVDAGYQLVYLLIMGVILGTWR
jgi:hypothetical protein